MFFAILLILFVGVCLTATGIRVVSQQTVCIVETFGKYSGILRPGLNVIAPLGISQIVDKIDLRITEKKVMVEVKTRDNAFVVLPTSLMLKVDPDKIWEAYYKLDKPIEQVSRWVLNSVRAGAATLTLNEVFEDREKIRKHIKDELADKVSEFGYILEDILIDQPTVSDELQKASNRVVEAQRMQEAATAEAEANRTKITKAAAAESEAQVLRAQGIAKARNELVNGLNENIKAIKESGVPTSEVLDLLLTINRYDAMRDVGSNKNLIIMDTLDPAKALQAIMAKHAQDMDAVHK